jgi:NAD(P)-dependent dehydrogenase (short-subunit alcohol dehydrogenase family)
MISLQNKVAIMTAAGSGIGRAAALLLARYGAKVILVARDRVRLEEVASEIRHANGISGADELRENSISPCEARRKRRGVEYVSSLCPGVEVKRLDRMNRIAGMLKDEEICFRFHASCSSC